jgi:2-polyprenyl-3-methyl-5-hydroxy-6-metoxy-1,4-benzoquinol methylase
MVNYNKFILDFQDKEVIEEMSNILGRNITDPFKSKGWITNTKNSYVKNGEVDEKLLEDIYNHSEYIESYIEILSITSLRRRPADLFSYIRSIKPGMKVLDYGCGVSTHGIACSQKGAEVHSLDISDRMLEISKKRFEIRNLNFIPHKNNTNFDSDFFDFVMMEDVIEHLIDPIQTLKQIISWMKIGGHIHLQVSKAISYEKGHLPDSINAWFSNGIKLLNKYFDKISPHTYILKTK